MPNSNTIYADYQATTPVDPRVVEKMAPHWRELFGNPHSGDHIVGWQAAKAVDQSKTTVAGLIGADPDEIIFTSGATEANNLALIGLARRAPPGQRHILVGATEHKCVLAAARALEARENFTVEQIPVDREGFIDLDALADRLGETTLVVSIMLVNNEVGTIQDIPRIAEIVKRSRRPPPLRRGTGRVRSGHEPFGRPCRPNKSIRAQKYTGRRALVPCTSGGIFKRGLSPSSMAEGSKATCVSGTVPVPLCVGMAAAAEILQTDEGVTERKRVAGQRDAFVERLQASAYPISINGPTGDRRHRGNANLRFEGFVAQEVLGALQPHLAASTGSACTSGIPEPSHVLRALGLTPAQSDASIRFSFGRFTTDAEIHQAATLVINRLAAAAGHSA